MEAALSSVVGIEGKTVLDATNLYGGTKPPAGFASNAEYVRSVTGGPTAKTFNANFASLFDRVPDARVWPSNLWSGDDQAKDVVERLSLDAGYEAIRLGQLTAASIQEGLAGVLFGIAQSGLGEFVYRMAPPEQL
ncbi:coenzyme F420-dependent NADP oxidoreductase [Actinoplanes friuliensis DSM 7358]|uniref:Coenzyme F420-dependent NADP oxidoreductase n=1 Tax=Actinoplanes friuliensis DSM 7358 TaxID=1246995 RepID=U5VUR6_9ACTN|nr:coenzyme F420-dependent NADP oxidoreductase [Actinoplanes friuliensis DSM 7358]